MFTVFQIISLTVLTGVIIYDNSHTQFTNYGRLVIIGLIAGSIMGNVSEGLLIGGTLELMSLGVASFGGAAIPNYMLGAIIGIAFAIATHGGIEAGLAVGIPVAALGVQLDLLSKMVALYFLHKAQDAAKRRHYSSMYHWILVGLVERVALLMVVVLLTLTVGSGIITQILALMPKWLALGLAVAGGVLPAVGFSVLLKYLPLHRYFVYAMLGFLLSSYFNLPIIGIAGFGFIIAYLIYVKNEQDHKAEFPNEKVIIPDVKAFSLLTKKDVKRARNRWMFTQQMCFNYESMQAASVVYAVGPALQKIHADDPEALDQSIATHFRFFNTHPWMGNIILSAAMAVEENGKQEGIEAASSIRTSLMGPFAGLGDSILMVLPKTIFGAIAAYMALEGNFSGAVLCIALGLLMWGMRIKFWSIGYKQGVRFVTSSASKLNSITDASAALGLVVVGALIASNVKVNIPVTFTIGQSVTKLQDILNRILPNLMPLLLVLGTFKALGLKKMTSTKMVWILIGLSIAGAFLGLLA